jgi:hypothetical protein
MEVVQSALEVAHATVQAILETLHAEKGKVCLEYLRSMTNDQAKQELQRWVHFNDKRGFMHSAS